MFTKSQRRLYTSLSYKRKKWKCNLILCYWTQHEIKTLTHTKTHTHTHTHIYIIYMCMCVFVYIYIYITQFELWVLKFNDTKSHCRKNFTFVPPMVLSNWQATPCRLRRLRYVGGFRISPLKSRPLLGVEVVISENKENDGHSTSIYG